MFASINLSRTPGVTCRARCTVSRSKYEMIKYQVRVVRDENIWRENLSRDFVSSLWRIYSWNPHDSKQITARSKHRFPSMIRGWCLSSCTKTGDSLLTILGLIGVKYRPSIGGFHGARWRENATSVIFRRQIQRPITVVALLVKERAGRRFR